jgi:hypothetical protein
MTCERHRAAADARWLALVLEGLSPDGLFYQGAAMRYSEPVRVAA